MSDFLSQEAQDTFDLPSGELLSGKDSSQRTTEASYIIGIDLGTTNSVLAYKRSDAAQQATDIEVLAIPQIQSSGAIESRAQLPSFIYFPTEQEFQADQLQLPWADPANSFNDAQYLRAREQVTIVGEFARRLGVKAPKRWICSAKSWLCQGGAIEDRSVVAADHQDSQTEHLPLDAASDIRPLSALAATELYLAHLQSAWLVANPEHPFADQSLVVAIPASFDPLARELTAGAISRLGVTDFTLLEEPQSALYAWLSENPDWRDQLEIGDTLLVVDVGGGTTDFSLISVSEIEGDLSLERVAVGNHILLGGDNMDLALAYAVKQQIEQSGKRLQAWQVTGLTQSCRQAKELLLSDMSLEQAPVTVPSRGSSLLGKTVRAELTRSLLTQVLLEGFFPHCDLHDRPVQASSQRLAMRTKGLPYAQDPAITRHLSGFLNQQGFVESQAAAASVKMPTKLLLNGGVFRSEILADRLLSIVNSWYGQSAEEDSATTSIGLLNHPQHNEESFLQLDLAVAKGAVFFRDNEKSGVRIRSGLANSYYIGIESSMPAIPGFAPPLQAVCIAPFGMEAGSRIVLPETEFQLLVGQPVQFRFFGSSIRTGDPVGYMLEYWDPQELTELPVIEAALSLDEVSATAQQDSIAVTLAAHATEIGTLELSAHAVHSDQSWKISLDVALKG